MKLATAVTVGAGQAPAQTPVNGLLEETTPLGDFIASSAPAKRAIDDMRMKLLGFLLSQRGRGG